MKPIKICFVSLNAYHLFNPEIYTRFGGAEIQLYYLATGLAKGDNFDVSFIVGDFGQPDFEIYQGVKLYKLYNSYKGIKYIRAIFGFLKLINFLRKINADLYIQRAVGLETGIISIFCRLFNKKFVYMVAHDEDIINKRPGWMPRGIISWCRWLLFKIGLRNTSLVIVQHQSQKDILKKQYNKESVVRLSAHIISEKIDMLEKQFVLWVARCDDWKQPEIYLRLAAKFPEEKLMMVCPISNDINYFERIKEEALKLSNLEFVEYVTFHEMDDYFIKAKIFINTSKTEGFPNTFIQAAKNKTPIISLNVNPDGILEKYKVGLCANGDFSRLTEHLETLLENKTLLQEMAEDAYRYAKENHNIKKIIEGDKKLFREIL